MSYKNILDTIDCMRGPAAEITTLKQAKMMQGIVEGKNATEAAYAAGFGVAQARTPWKLINTDELRRRFQEAADSKGLTIDRMADKIAEHLEARANQTLEGKQVTQSDAPDYKVQQKALDQLTNLIGMGDAPKAQQAGSSITVSVTGAAAERLAAAFGGE